MKRRPSLRIENPYRDLSNPGQWLRGNLHTHTTRSDGTRDVQVVLDDYAARGYDFLMISDHDIFTGPHDYTRWNTRRMIMIPGNEISARGPHMLHVNAERRIAPASRSRVLRAVAKHGGFIVACHPNWGKSFSHCKQRDLQRWSGITGIEIYNGIVEFLPGSALATDRWDMLLSAGRRVWGFAHDDSHSADHVAMGWNVAYAHQRSVAGIVDALLSGRFYTSTGVVISSIEVKNRRVRIVTKNADRIIAIREHGRRFASADAREIEIPLDPDMLYVRFECFGRGQQIAWTQPIFLTRA